MGALKPNPKTDNIIQLTMINGKLGRKPKVRYNKDGSIDKRNPRKPKGVSSTVYPFDTEEIKAMMTVINNRIEEAPDDDKRRIAWRNKTLFLIAINVGLRASDLLKLKYSHFFNEDMSFKELIKLIPKKQEKTGNFVEIFFNETVEKVLRTYIEEYPIESLDEYVFKSRKGSNPIREGSFLEIIVGIAKEAGITKNVGTHSCRKTWARQRYDNAEDKAGVLDMIQECFAHSSSKITLRYISIMSEEKKKMYKDIELGIEYI